MNRVWIVATIVIMAVSAAYAQEGKKPYRVTQEDTDRGIGFANELIKMRSALAGTHIKPKGVINEDTAKKICIAVAERAKEMAEYKIDDKGIYIIRFPSEKPRNPVNSPIAGPDDERPDMRFFDEDSERKEKWHGVEIDGKQYYRYMKPILAEKPCLACHGAEKKVPAFIKKMYPADKSFGFKEGDIMGAVAVYTWKGF